MQQWVVAHATTPTKTLRLAKYFFDKLFKPEVDGDARGAIWDFRMVGAAQSTQGSATQAATTPDVCAKLDSILITANATCAKADVDDAF